MAVFGSIGRGVRKSVSGTTGFFRGSVQELKKVKWPTRKEMVAYTSVVIFTIIILTLFLGVIDLGLSELVKLIYNKA
ncbi:preprotein translocase subunit SecE [Hazenella sp. IB182357]|uniref:Protein translocase subunit SecE n=1 Tax=Polycladospora coralii TaxID=2771432 RepID=A0A926N9M8_9BACL|nr:preprotein translocase subunit SecE [Polycladospora coralii]MBD1372382.1 preprotein translocase subunit SecE [Polycladospora coralii]MBS7531428.1 preprotein translocase subunit SecE [Polycladospora coralii]